MSLQEEETVQQQSLSQGADDQLPNFEDQINQELSMSSEESAEEFQGELEAQDDATNEDGDEKSNKESSEKSDGGRQKKKGGKNEHPNQFEVFLASFNEQPDLEAKLQAVIDFMENSISLGSSPHFRNFWEARRLCLPLFKENVNPVLRSHLWNKFSELSKEARRLKEILDEQSAFAVEQIEIAVTALEQEINQFDELAEKAVVADEIIFPSHLEDRKPFYFGLQKQLNILNAQASRINALRKELLKTEMRIRQKNKFFQRLSSAGDLVFPKRKELIRQISQDFMEDVNQFIKFYFTDEKYRDVLYSLREEIKLMQGLAKLLTLNTNAFTQTRMRLSECWDKIKVEEKDRKKERAQQRVAFKQNAEAIHNKLQEIKTKLESGEEGKGTDWLNQLNEINNEMRQTQLGRDEIKELRDLLNDLRRTAQVKVKGEEALRQQQDEERKRQKRALFDGLKGKMETLIEEHEKYSADDLIQARELLLQEVQETQLTKIEKQELERSSKPLKDIISEKQERALLDMSEDDKQSLLQLQDVLKQRKERRQAIKNQLEILRKSAGSSGLDFEKAMQFTTQANEEKERLEKSNQGIEEIEKKIVQIKSKLRKS